MLMPTRSHNWSVNDKQRYKTPVIKEDQWHMDYNHNAYQENRKPKTDIYLYE